MSFEAFPGGDLVEKGLADLAASRETVESLLVSIGAPRLRLAGIPVPDKTFPNPERRLYDRLVLEGSRTPIPLTPATTPWFAGS